MSWAFLLLGARRVLTGVITWLSHRSFWQLVSMALAGLLLIQYAQLADARHDRDAYKGQRDYYKAQIDQADKAVRAAQAEMLKVSKQLKDRTDEENRRIAGDADALRVRGPGKAACRPTPAAASDHDAAAKPDAPGPALPTDDRAGVSWDWLTTRAEEHDRLLSETKAWREWYQRLVESWPKTK